MTSLNDCPQGRSQYLTFPRRELLQKAASAALLPFLARLQPATPSSKFPKPKFAIGDLIASDWEGDEDEDAPQSATDYGEVVGLCYLPEDGSYYPRHTWVYYIYWTHSTSSACFCYPCFDGEMTEGSALRLVRHD